jgi:hypothetical protein
MVVGQTGQQALVQIVLLKQIEREFKLKLDLVQLMQFALDIPLSLQFAIVLPVNKYFSYILSHTSFEGA